jgi:hypothetical protein
VPGDTVPQLGIDPGGTGLRVRRSWSTLSDAEKSQVIDAFIALKNTPTDYTRFCDPGVVDAPDLVSYGKNKYDYYVEAHYAAFVSMDTDDMDHMQMAHMGPQFLPWHRYLLLRLEADLQEASGDPEFTLPYWGWEDCDEDLEACSAVFDAFLGSSGSCDADDQAVTGQLVDGGQFTKNIWTDAGLTDAFTTGSLRCSDAPLERAVSCDRDSPATVDDITAMYDRVVYDTAPYDSCSTDATVSFRQ